MIFESHSETWGMLKTSCVGILGTVGGFITSLNVASDVMKFVSLLIGTIIGSISLYRLVFGKNKRKKNEY